MLGTWAEQEVISGDHIPYSGRIFGLDVHQGKFHLIAAIRSQLGGKQVIHGLILRNRNSQHTLGGLVASADIVTVFHKITIEVPD